jgi:uridine phosphorylase
MNCYTGTSARYTHLNRTIAKELAKALQHFSPAIESGSVGTTDAPYRETAEAIEAAKAEGILAVEMEAASLYAFAQARKKPVVCFAHITNQMGRIEGDFEKGEADGSAQSLRLIEAVAECWMKGQSSRKRVCEQKPPNPCHDDETAPKRNAR